MTTLGNEEIKRLMQAGDVSTLKKDGEATLSKALAWSKKKIIGFQSAVSAGKAPVGLCDFFTTVISEAGANDIDDKFQRFSNDRVVVDV